MLAYASKSDELGLFQTKVIKNVTKSLVCSSVGDE
jgi:hypothetical protein